MPKPRDSRGARADARPAFSRPPGARPPARPPSPVYNEDYDASPRSTPKRAPKEGHRQHKSKQSPAPSPADRDRRDRRRKSSSPIKEKEKERDRAKYSSGTSTNSGTHLLSANALAQLNNHNEKTKFQEKSDQQKQKKKDKQYKNLRAAEPKEVQRRRRKKNRNVSGAILEEGRGKGHGRRKTTGYEKEYEAERREGMSKRKKWLIIGGVALVIIIIIIVAAVVASNNNKSSSGGGGGGGSSSNRASSGPSNDCDGTDIPPDVAGTYLDVSTWLDTSDFNCTYTAQTIGGLSVMGLNSEWDDSTRANDKVPALDEGWDYGNNPIRGVNVGGWLSIEPFITPSLFEYPASDQVVDEYTLSAKLAMPGRRVIENHYATFITKQDFVDIANAGLDHVRIPYPYWIVTTYDGDPYLPQVGWRYLLRAIEWARESGLRVKLDLHAAPGSQNGWTHSGRLGSIDWISGPNGAQNAQRTLDIHTQLATFFAQDRYKNIITIYGLVNEPKMLVIPEQSVVDWNTKAVQVIRDAGVSAYLAFGDGFLALTDWQGVFQDVDPKLLLDTHQYQIFNVGQLSMNHHDRIRLACSGWSGLIRGSNNPETGWGPTMDGEWSQADTDCTQHLNNVGVGSRWTGTLNMNDPEMNVLTPSCPSEPCSCAQAIGEPSQYSSEYKQFLQMYAEAQMNSFEQAWGWFYWTWKTENAVQWSWKLGLEAGILPSNARSPSFKCEMNDIPEFSSLGSY